MYRLKEEYSQTIEIDKSKFITYFKRVFSEEEAKAYIHQIQKEHPNATHHCYAFMIGENNQIQRSNDNGEPSGTAGVPMLESLRKNQVQDIIAITVRYFGGIKLGAGGLIRAYSKSVSNALQQATLCRKVNMLEYQLSFSYEYIGKLDYYFQQHQIMITNKEYDELVRYTYLCLQPLDKDIAETTSGVYLPVFIMEKTIEEEVHLPQD